MLLYHYTSSAHLPVILHDGVIKPFKRNNQIDRPVVWLLDKPKLDYPHGLENSKYSKGHVRITVNTEAFRWQNWAPTRLMTPQEFEGFVLPVVGGMRAIKSWWLSTEGIPRDNWIDVSHWSAKEDEFVSDWCV